MIDVRPVREPQRRRDGAVGLLIALVLTGLGVAILKPWQAAGPAQLALASPVAAESPSPSVPNAVGGYRNYSPDLFGDHTHAPAFELWAAGYYINFGFSRLLPFVPAPVPAGGLDAGGALDLGPSGTTTALGINHPADTALRAIRLWRFDGGRSPVRVSIVTLPPPFGLTTFNVIGIPESVGSDRLANWTSGLYRLDLLAASPPDRGADRVISLSLRVERDPTSTPPPSLAPSSPPVYQPDLTVLRDLARPGGLLAIGPGTVHSLALAANDRGRGVCALPQIWAAEAGGDQRCSAMLVSRVFAMAYDAGPRTVIRAVRLTSLDPVGAVVGIPDLTVQPGLALVLASNGRLFPEGTYRLDVTVGDGSSRAWYFQVAPGGADAAKLSATPSPSLPPPTPQSP